MTDESIQKTVKKLEKKAAQESLKSPEILQLVSRNTLMDVSPDLTTILRIYISQESFSKFSIIKKLTLMRQATPATETLLPN